jgi:hypothetical protein
MYLNCQECRVVDLSPALNHPSLQYIYASSNFLTNSEEYDYLKNNLTNAYLDDNFYYAKPNQRAFYSSTNPLTLTEGSLAEINFTVYATTDGKTYAPAEISADLTGLNSMAVVQVQPGIVTLITHVANTGDGLVTQVTGDAVGETALSICYFANESTTAILPLITGETTMDVTVTQA